MSATTTSTPMSEVLQLQRASFHRDGPPSAAVRRDRIDRFTHAVVSNADELVEAISADFGTRPAVTTLVTDIVTLAQEAEMLRASVGKWMKPTYPAGRIGGTLMRAAGIRSRVVPSPKGVVGVMGIWNFPINLTAIPALTALAAGNRVMIKLPEKLPATSELLANAWHDVFDVEEVAAVTGGTETSIAFSGLDLDHLFFTGSADVGSKIMASAAKHLTPVTLELGGKNPVVISEKVANDRGKLRRAAQRVAASRIINAGQVCLNPDEAYVPNSMMRLFVQEIFNAWGETIPDLIATSEYTSLIDDDAYERVTALVEDAASRGAQVVHAFNTDENGVEALKRDRLFPPTVIIGVTDEMRIAHEEVFGPVLAVYGYENYGDVVKKLNSRPSPLVATWYGKHDADFEDFVARTRSGGVARNDWGLTNAIPFAPFGGVGTSGLGKYHGKYGFEEFSHLRNVTESSLPFSLTELVSPPGAGIDWAKGMRSYAGMLARRLRR